MGPDWDDMDDGKLTNTYQDALDEVRMGKDDEDRNWSDDDIADMEREIGERDGL